MADEQSTEGNNQIMDQEEKLYKLAKEYGYEVDCVISQKDTGWFYGLLATLKNIINIIISWFAKIEISINTFLFNEYINVFKGLEERYFKRNNQNDTLQGLRAICAVQKAKIDGRSIFMGFFISLVGIVMSIVLYWKQLNGETVDRSCCEYLFCVLIVAIGFLLIVSTYMQVLASIRCSAVNDAADLVKKTE